VAQEHAGAGRSALSDAADHDWPLIAAATLGNLAIAAGLLALAGSDVAGTELALRTTARVSFAWFMMGFLASPLEQLSPSRISAWLMQRRRALGVIFGLSMSIHVAFILRLYVLHNPFRPPMVTDADFYIGIPGLVFVAMMTVTSFDMLKTRMTERGWEILFLCLVDSVSRKTTSSPFLAYHAFILILLLGAMLRILAARGRNSPGTAVSGT
jgi:DMSO/TMAO reductase YedYZ heme-binding membrane subunit